MKKVILFVGCFFLASVTFAQISAGEEDIVIDPLILYLRTESVGGKLDFNAVLEKDEQSLYLCDGKSYNKKDYAIYLWGQAVQQHAAISKSEAIILWEEIYGRALARQERKVLERGFAAK